MGFVNFCRFGAAVIIAATESVFVFMILIPFFDFCGDDEFF